MRNKQIRIVVLLGALGAGASASDWPRWRGPEGNGVSAETEWKPQALGSAPKVLWRANVGAGHSGLIVAGGRLFTLGNQGGKDLVHCLDAEKGKPVWQMGYACAAGNFGGPRATPTLEGGLLYTLSRNGHALCLESETGKVKWQKDLIKDFGAKNVDYGLTGSPLVLGEAVFYNAGTAGLALKKATGEKLWASAPGPCGYASPVPVKLKDREAVAVFGATELALADPSTGEKLAVYPWRTQFDANAADPVYFDAKLFITSGWDRGCTLLDLSGARIRMLWENQNFRGHFASPVHLGGHLYGVDGNTPNGELRCLDVEKGQLKWAQRGGFENLMVAGGRIVAIDKKGALLVAEAAPGGFKEIAKATLLSAKAKNWTAPLLSNGLLYVRNGDGDLVCVDLR